MQKKYLIVLNLVDFVPEPTKKMRTIKLLEHLFKFGTNNYLGTRISEIKQYAKTEILHGIYVYFQY